MSDKQDPAESGRDMAAEAVASRSGKPIEHARDAIEKTGSRGKSAEAAVADAKARNPNRRER